MFQMGTGKFLLINAAIHAVLACLVIGIGDSKCSVGPIDGGVIFGIHGFIVGPIVFWQIAKIAGEGTDRHEGGDIAVGAVFGIMIAGIVGGILYIGSCNI
jgi:hypothetical protein